MTRLGSAFLARSCALALTLGICPQAHAGYTVVVQQINGNVVANGSGTLSLGALTLTPSIFDLDPSISGSQGIAWLGEFGSSVDFYSGITGPSSFGSGFQVDATSGTGNFVGVYGSAGNLVLSGGLSGLALGASSATWMGQTYSSLGIDPGTYTWRWGSGVNADFFTLEITPVPEPAFAGALVGVLAIVVLALRHAQRTAISFTILKRSKSNESTS